MKATIRYRFGNAVRQLTITNVKKNEPNSIVQEFIRQTRLPRNTYISTIKCGLTKYEWKGSAVDAFPSR